MFENIPRAMNAPPQDDSSVLNANRRAAKNGAGELSKGGAGAGIQAPVLDVEGMLANSTRNSNLTSRGFGQ